MVFNNEQSKICGRQSLKTLNWYKIVFRKFYMAHSWMPWSTYSLKYTLIVVNLLMQEKEWAHSKTPFSEKKIFKSSKIFPASCLSSVDLKMSLKLLKKIMSSHFTRILFMKASHICWSRINLLDKIKSFRSGNPWIKISRVFVIFFYKRVLLFFWNCNNFFESFALCFKHMWFCWQQLKFLVAIFDLLCSF